MVLIYSHTTSPRLQYTCNFIFKELLNLDFSITIDSEEFKNYDGVKINYSNQQIDGGGFKIENCNLLFETAIKEQAIECFVNNNYKAFFKTANSDFAFDIFAATFYLLSRYEEYLPHTKDMYGRYAHENSIAFKEGFFTTAVSKYLGEGLCFRNKEKMFNIQCSMFNVQVSIDL